MQIVLMQEQVAAPGHAHEALQSVKQEASGSNPANADISQTGGLDSQVPEHQERLSATKVLQDSESLAPFQGSLPKDALPLGNSQTKEGLQKVKGMKKQEQVSTDTDDQATKKEYASAIIRRFKGRLDGQYKDSGDRIGTLTVSQQVDKLIQKATNLDNLARMYEGWTPWI